MTVLPGCAAADDGGTRYDGSVADSAGAPGDLVGTPLPFEGYQSVYAVASDAVTVRYRSTSGVDGSPTVVSGTVFVPKGTPPADGWPVISIGHSTTGVAPDCAPSLYPDLLGSLSTVLAGVQRGFVVVMTDYEGLGAPGAHPYLEPTTAAYNVIDAVRAARQVVPESSTRWAAFGYSQGGQATWAANEVAGEYGQGLDLVATVALAPAADVSGLVDLMESGSLTEDQKMVLPLLLRGLQEVHPDLRIEDYLAVAPGADSAVFSYCTGIRDQVKEQVIDWSSLQVRDPMTKESAAQLRGWLSDAALPNGVTSAPMYVAYGARDELVFPDWTAQAVREACALGDELVEVVYPDMGHDDLDASGPAVEWLLERFAGTPMQSTCG